MEWYWPSFQALQPMGEGLDLVGYLDLCKLLFYACLPSSCSWTLAKPTVFPVTVQIYLKTLRPDSQNPKLPLWVRRVILIQCHLAHPSVWPWNPGICSLLLLGFVRWQAKTLVGNLDQLTCTVMCVCTHTWVHMSLWLPPRAERKAKCWLRSLSLLWWPVVEAAVARKHAGSPCAIPTDQSGWPPVTIAILC